MVVINSVIPTNDKRSREGGSNTVVGETPATSSNKKHRMYANIGEKLKNAVVENENEISLNFEKIEPSSFAINIT